MLTHPQFSFHSLLLSGAFILPAARASAADVTPDRLANADREPQNWLMNHRTYDAQRYSPLDRINRGNVKDLRPAYAVAIGGTSANESLQSTPLAEDGLLDVVAQWGVLYKIDSRPDDSRRIVWRMYACQEKGWEAGGGGMWGAGSFDVAANQLLWGAGNPVAMFDPYYRPGDNLYTNSLISWNPDTGKMNWFHQYLPGDMWDYDEAGTHILVDGQVAGQTRKLVTHSGRNGFLYTFERSNGQTVLAKPYLDE